MKTTPSQQACRRLTREYAKTFYFASHVLPPSKRMDAYAVYAFCRYVDDQVDLAPDERARQTAVGHLEQLLASTYSEPRAMPDHLPWLPAFCETVQRRAIPRDFFEDLLTGVRMDIGRVRLSSWNELERYCYHVAGVVGLIMVHVLAEPRPELLRPAQDLGTAMQLTNILRDIGEDWQRDRIYLPADELARFQLNDDAIAQARTDANFREMIRSQISRARNYYRAAEPGIRALPNDGSRYCARLMSTVYGAILDEIERADYQVFHRRARVSLPRKLRLAARAYFQLRD